MSSTSSRHCCFVGDTGPCEALADFEIGRLRPASNPEGGENTDACAHHVGHLLGYVNEPHEGGWWVFSLSTEAGT